MRSRKSFGAAIARAVCVIENRPRFVAGLVASVLLSFALSAWLLRLACAPLARACVGQLIWLGVLVAPAVGHTESSDEQDAPASEGDEEPAVAPAEQPPPSTAARAPVRRGKIAPPDSELRSGQATKPRTLVTAGLDVNAELVRRASIPRNRPAGVFVNAESGHPCGIEIRNAGILADRIRPGDILVEVEGHPIRGWPVLIGTVTRAYQRRAEAVHGKLWRGGTVMAVTVHIPYESKSPSR